jgi:hypothetical protein
MTSKEEWRWKPKAVHVPQSIRRPEGETKARRTLGVLSRPTTGRLKCACDADQSQRNKNADKSSPLNNTFFPSTTTNHHLISTRCFKPSMVSSTRSGTRKGAPNTRRGRQHGVGIVGVDGHQNGTGERCAQIPCDSSYRDFSLLAL